jgi:Mrp family chromosome partitioning ATPase
MHFRAEPRIPLIRARDDRVQHVLPEFRRLYYIVQSLQAAGEHKDGVEHAVIPLLLQFVSAVPHEGVTSTGFALATEAEHRGSILVLDCHSLIDDDRYRFGGRGMNIGATFRGRLPVASAVAAVNREVATANETITWARLGDEPVPMAALGEMFHQIRQSYSLVILDCPALSLAPKTAAVSSLCDATILVVKGGSTNRDHARSAKYDIELHGGKLIGVVANRCRYR